MLAVAASEQPQVPLARAGNPDAWSALFQRYQLPLYVYIFELVRHEQTSLDLVQETFINAVRHLGSLRHDAKFGSWLFSIAHQKCLQHWRKQGKEDLHRGEMPEGDLELLPGDNEQPDESLVREEQEEEFMQFLNQLPPPHRSVLLLHYLEDFSLDEIAEITGAPLGTVKSRLHYARQTLRKLLEEKAP